MREPWRWTIAVVLALSVAAAPCTASADTPKTAEPSKTEPETAPEKPATAEDLQKRLLATPEDAKLTDQLIVLFKQFALARAKEELDEELPESFWTWLAEQPTIRDALLVELHPEYKPGIPKCLEALRKEFGAEVTERPHLALAFAAVFGRARGGRAWGPQSHYLRRDRKAPTMEASFRYYLKNEKVMRFSLKKTPWPLLAYLADNETPIRERVWALKNYATCNDSRLARVYNDLRYDWDKLVGKPRIGDRPRTLANLKKYGGVCIERAYFASRVYKSMGIPAMCVTGQGRRGGHAWVAWISRKNKSYCMNSQGRFFYDKYYVGNAWYPPTRGRMLDREVELIAAAVGRSYDEYLNTRIGCHLYRMFNDEEPRKDRTRLLKDAAERNPFVADPWRLLAQARVDDVISQTEGEKLFDIIFRALGAYPDLTYEVLEKVLTPRLDIEGDEDADEITRNLKILSRAFAAYNDAKRPDLAVKLCLLKGSYLEAIDRKKSALKLYVMASDNYAKEHYGFRDVFDRALLLMAGRKDLRRRLKFCDMMVKKVPRQRGDVDKKRKQFNPAYVYVVRAYIRALEEAGKDRAARHWEEKITTR